MPKENLKALFATKSIDKDNKRKESRRRDKKGKFCFYI